MAGSITCRDVGEADAALWDRLVEASPGAWLWHDRLLRDYALAAARDRNPVDRSFIVLADGQPVALAPLAIEDADAGGRRLRATGYYGSPLPWPCVVADAPDRAAIELFALAELEHRSRAEGAGHFRLQWWPERPESDERRRLVEVFRSRRYIGREFRSHVVPLDVNTLGNVRERFRRYVRKFCDHYDLDILGGNAVDAAVEEVYFQLHVADAVGQFRPRESYDKFADIARQGRGFFVMATAKTNRRPAGMLAVFHNARVAYDASVCVEPSLRDDQISVLLKWRAIEHLLERGIHHYELGYKAEFSDWLQQPSAKNIGISFFKEGWARNCDRSVYVAETFFDSASYAAVAAHRTSALAAAIGLENAGA